MSEQMAAIRAWGVDTTDKYAKIYTDDVRKVRTTAPDKVLKDRNEAIRQLAQGDVLFFKSPACVGFSVNDAAKTIEAVFGKGAMVYIHSADHLYAKGDDIASLLADVQRENNTARMGKYRKGGSDND